MLYSNMIKLAVSIITVSYLL